MKRNIRKIQMNAGRLTPEEVAYGKKIGQMRQQASRQSGINDQTFTAGQSATSDEIGGQAEVFYKKKCKEEIGEEFAISEVNTFHSEPDVGGTNVRYAGKAHYKLILKLKDKSDIPMVSISGDPQPPQFTETGWVDPGQIREIYYSIMEVLEAHPEAQKALDDVFKPYWLKSHEEMAIPRNWLNHMSTLNRKFKP